MNVGTNSDGVSYDEPDFDVLATDSDAPTLALFSGTAADLECWLWHRPPYRGISRSGDPVVVGRLWLGTHCRVEQAGVLSEHP